MTAHNPKEKNKKSGSKTWAILLGLILLGILSYLAYELLSPQPEVLQTAPVIISEETSPPAQPPPAGPLSATTDHKAGQLEGPDDEEPGAPETADQCDKTVAALAALFERLDRASYIKEFQLKQGTAHHCGLLARKLFANPPTIVRETDNLFSILNNMTHFYRILGKWNILLLKEFLVREEENLEEILALFYSWSKESEQCQTTAPAPIDLPLAGLYEYAGFFLDTMGGQSYLFRRQSKIRLLVKYYAILILNRANDQKLNHHGLDIRPPLDSLIREMETFPELHNREDYLQELYTLQDSYQTRYGRP